MLTTGCVPVLAVEYGKRSVGWWDFYDHRWKGEEDNYHIPVRDGATIEHIPDSRNGSLDDNVLKSRNEEGSNYQTWLSTLLSAVATNLWYQKILDWQWPQTIIL